ncbi:inositol 2-dehydrogenase [Hahella sp. KA22]|uniref:inositol 2-dehydrogenase n=1 Tax=Hahella sp. KA22 TaxID=1628392 RepID=UPI000FDED9F1|nr:inositol 2-dehydrogenase [Hahella sp. KA22]AZZ90592.1 inositol 2-dehydrogenase [Hahella sp. KA22]QAY53962.1 inositol 2-dehydrogenase [Hahella sp. KA22]
MIRISLLGAGRIGVIHALNAKANLNVDLRYIADPREEAARDLAEKVGAKVVDVNAAINADDVDAVIIATSTNTHAELSHAALNAGKAVFCEKPIDLDINSASGVAEHVQQSGLPYFVAFNRRFDPSFAALQRGLGDLGKLEQLVITSRDPSPPPVEYIKVSGGLFRDMTIHDFDMALWLLNEPLRDVHAIGSCQVDPAIGQAGDIDTATITLTTVSGAQCVILNSRRAAYGYDQRVEAFGAKGMLQAHNIKPTQLHRFGAEGESSDRLEDFFLQRYAAAYQAEMAAFVQALVTQSPMPVGVQDGVNALKLANAAYASLEQGKPVGF